MLSTNAAKQLENVAVAVRVRPLNSREKNSAQTSIWDVVEGHTLRQSLSDRGSSPAVYTYDKVFDTSSTNIEVYNGIAKNIVKSAVEGYSGTIFAYGQTSSGKTFTMNGSNREPGVIPLAISDIFNSISQDETHEYLLRISYCEIYNEVIRDLVNPDNFNLKIHEDVTRGVFVGNLTELVITDIDDIFTAIENGEKNRHVGETNMNERSSRSHTILTMYIESRQLDEPSERGKRPSYSGAVRSSKLNLVDLAGSERVGLTGAEGIRLKEGGHINKSLLTLGTVIARLSEGGDGRHIPYRDSKLTRILQPSLGGNARTAIICTITPASNHLDDTLSTLKFASRAKTVKNKPTVFEITTDEALLKRYRKEIDELKLQLDMVLSKNSETTGILQQKEEEQAELRRKYNDLTHKILNSNSLHIPPNPLPKRSRKDRRMTWFPGIANPVLEDDSGEAELEAIHRSKRVRLQEPVELEQPASGCPTSDERGKLTAAASLDHPESDLERIILERDELAAKVAELEKSQSNNALLEQSASELTIERDEFKERISVLESERHELLTKFTSAQDDASNVELSELKNELKEAQAATEKIAAERNDLKHKLTTLESEKDEKINALISDNQSLNIRLTELESEKISLRERTRDLEQYRDRLDDSENELKEYRGKIVELTKVMKDCEEKNNELESQLQEAQKKASLHEAGAGGIQKELEEAAEQIDEMKSTMRAIESIDIACIKAGLEIPCLSKLARQIIELKDRSERERQMISMQCRELKTQLEFSEVEFKCLKAAQEEELETTESIIRQRDETLHQVMQENEALQTRITDLEHLNKEKNQEISKLQAELQGSTSEASKLAGENERLYNRLEELQEALVERNKTTKELSSRLEQTQADLEQTRTESEELVERMKNELELLSNESEGLLSGRNEAVTMITQLEVEKRDLNDKLKIAEGSLKGAEDKLDELMSDLQKRDEQLAQKESAVSDLESKLAASEGAMTDIREELEVKSIELSEARTKLEENCSNLAVISTEKQELVNQLNCLRTDYCALESQIASLSQELESAVSEMHQLQEQKEAWDAQQHNIVAEIDSLRVLHRTYSSSVETSESIEKDIIKYIRYLRTEWEQKHVEYEQMDSQLKEAHAELKLLADRELRTENDSDLVHQIQNLQTDKDSLLSKLQDEEVRSAGMASALTKLSSEIASCEIELRNQSTSIADLQSQLITLEDEKTTAIKERDELSLKLNQVHSANQGTTIQEQNLQIVISQQQQDLKRMREVQDNLEGEASRLSVEKADAEVKLRECEIEKRDHEAKVQLLEQIVSVEKEKNAKFGEEMDSQLDLIRRLEAELQALTEEKIMLTEHTESLKLDIARMEATFSNPSVDSEASEELRLLQAELSSSKNDLQLVVEERGRLVSDLNDAQNQLESRAREMEILQTQYSEQLQNNSLLRDQHESLVVSFSDLETGKSQIDDQYTVLESEYNAFRAAHDSSLQEIQNISSKWQEECQNLQLQITELTSAVENLSNIRDELQNQVQEMDAENRNLAEQLNRFDNVDEQIRRLETELDEERRKSHEHDGILNQSLSEIQNLESMLAASTEEKQELSLKLVSAQSNSDNDERAIIELRQLIKELESTIAERDNHIEKLQSDIRELRTKSETSGFEHVELTSQIETLQSEIELLKRELESERSYIADRAATIESLNSKLSEYRKDSQKLKTENETLSSKLAEVQKTSEEYFAKIKKLQSQTDNGVRIVNEQQQFIESQDARIQELEESVRQKQNELNEIRKQVEVKQSELLEYSKNSSSFDSQIKKYRTLLEEKATELQQQRGFVSNLQSQLVIQCQRNEQLEVEVSKANGKQLELEQELRNVELASSKLKRDLTDMSVTIERQKEEVTSLRHNLSASNLDREELRSRVAAQETSIKNYMSRINSLQDQLTESQESLNQTQNLLEQQITATQNMARENRSLSSEKNNLSELLSQSQETVKILQEKTGSFDTELKNTREKLVEKLNLIKTLEAELTEMRADPGCTRQLAGMKTELENKSVVINGLRGELEKSAAEIENLRKENRTLVLVRNNETTKCRQLTDQVNRLMNERDKLQKEKGKLANLAKEVTLKESSATEEVASEPPVVPKIAKRHERTSRKENSLPPTQAASQLNDATQTAADEKVQTRRQRAAAMRARSQEQEKTNGKQPQTCTQQ